jgi:hypothetical protein
MPEDVTHPGFAPRGTSTRLTAYHEAGHAVMAQLCGRQVTEVEIVGDREHTGSMQSLAFPPDPAEGPSPSALAADLECRLKCVLAGTVAEGMISGREGWDETSGDLDLAVRLAMQLVDDCEDVLPLLEDLRIDVERNLRRHWPAVELLAGELLRRAALSGSEVRRLLTPLLT